MDKATFDLLWMVFCAVSGWHFGLTFSRAERRGQVSFIKHFVPMVLAYVVCLNIIRAFALEVARLLP